MESSFSHISADFLGVPPSRLADVRLLSGLLIAAAGAAGFSTLGAPQVRTLPNEGVTGWLQLDDCHIALHAFPARELLLLDVLSDSSRDGQKVVDVFMRRLDAREVRSERRLRG